MARLGAAQLCENSEQTRSHPLLASVMTRLCPIAATSGYALWVRKNAPLGGRTAPDARYLVTTELWYDGRAENAEKPPPVEMSEPVAADDMISVDAPAHCSR
jgi:hypothetical protein